MSQLVKKSRSVIPSVVNDFFNSERVLFPSIFDLDRGFMDSDVASLLPDANIIENDEDYKIELAAPGLEKKDFIVEMQDGILNISAEKEEDKKEENKNFKRREFSYNSFSRSFSLPENCLSDKIEAKYENGVLHLSLPKKEVTLSKPVKQIKVV
jgi:HSP20 family protein